MGLSPEVSDPPKLLNFLMRPRGPWPGGIAADTEEVVWKVGV